MPPLTIRESSDIFSNIHQDIEKLMIIISRSNDLKFSVMKNEMNIRQDCEQDMLSLTEQMKSIALSYSEHLQNDNKVIFNLQ